MLLAAARALGEQSPARKDPFAPLLPALKDVRTVARAIAVTVGLEAQRAGIASKASPEELEAWVKTKQWYPQFATYRKR